MATYSFSDFQNDVLDGSLDLETAYKISEIDGDLVKEYHRKERRETKVLLIGLRIYLGLIVLTLLLLVLSIALEMLGFNSSFVLGIMFAALTTFAVIPLSVLFFALHGLFVAVAQKRKYRDVREKSGKIFDALRTFCELTGCDTPALHSNTLRRAAKDAVCDMAVATKRIEILPVEVVDALNMFGCNSTDLFATALERTRKVFEQMKLLGILHRDMHLDSLFDMARDKRPKS